MSRRATAWVSCLAALCPLLVGSRCGGGDGSGGSVTVLELRSPDRRCVALADPGLFPPDFDFVPEAVVPEGEGVPAPLVSDFFLTG